MNDSFDAYYVESAAAKAFDRPEPRAVPTAVVPADLDAIYTFWFGCEGEGRAEHLDGDRIRLWMVQSDEMDAEVGRRFAQMLPVASRMSWDTEVLTPRQAVGLVVLFDQVPRNLHRTSGDAFRYDGLARDITTKLCPRAGDYTVAERFILALPFVHHEDERSQDIALMIAAREAVEATDETDRVHLRIAVDQATRHRDLIRRFGRFPHRNAMLGRPSTAEEEAFMAEHGRGF